MTSSALGRRSHLFAPARDRIKQATSFLALIPSLYRVPNYAEWEWYYPILGRFEKCTLGIVFHLFDCAAWKCSALKGPSSLSRLATTDRDKPHQSCLRAHSCGVKVHRNITRVHARQLPQRARAGHRTMPRNLHAKIAGRLILAVFWLIARNPTGARAQFSFVRLRRFSRQRK